MLFLMKALSSLSRDTKAKGRNLARLVATVLDNRSATEGYLMKQFRFLLALLIFPLLLSACAGEESTAQQGPQGPALIMFYTDN